MCVRAHTGAFIMSHSFTPREKVQVWESQRPFTGSITIFFEGLQRSRSRRRKNQELCLFEMCCSVGPFKCASLFHLLNALWKWKNTKNKNQTLLQMNRNKTPHAPLCLLPRINCDLCVSPDLKRLVSSNLQRPPSGNVGPTSSPRDISDFECE